MAEFDDRLVGVVDDDDDDDVRDRELDLEGADALADEGPNVVELAFGQRSWRFGHVIVDEAQDLTPMQWRMIVRRARGGSMTIVGDLAQRSTGPPTSWRDVLPETIKHFDQRELTINYRSPAEVNDLAANVLAELAPDLTPARSIRAAGEEPDITPVESLARSLPEIIDTERRQLGIGKLAVIGCDLDPGELDVHPDVVIVDPIQAKGLEFDVVVLVEPARILEEPHGLSQLYVALTRSTRRLRVVHHRPLPPVLAGGLGYRQSP